MKKFEFSIGFFGIYVGFYNLDKIIEFAEKYPGTQSPSLSWFGVIAPMIIGAIMIAYAFQAKKNSKPKAF